MDDDQNDLRCWLHGSAGLNPIVLENTLSKLHAEEVFTVDDLATMRDLGGMKDVLSRVTAAKVVKALDQSGFAPLQRPSARLAAKPICHQVALGLLLLCTASAMGTAWLWRGSPLTQPQSPLPVVSPAPLAPPQPSSPLPSLPSPSPLQPSPPQVPPASPHPAGSPCSASGHPLDRRLQRILAPSTAASWRTCRAARDGGLRADETQRYLNAARFTAGLTPVNLSSRNHLWWLGTHGVGQATIGANCSCVVYRRVWKSGNSNIVTSLHAAKMEEPDCPPHIEPFEFSFVRDPLAHFLSGYSEYVMRTEKAMHNGALNMSGVNIDMFGPEAVLQSMLEAGSKPPGIAPAHMYIQSPMLSYGSDKKMVHEPVGPNAPATFESVSRLRFIGRLERIDTEWAEAMRASGDPQLQEVSLFSGDSVPHATDAKPKEQMIAALNSRSTMLAALCVLLSPDYECFGAGPFAAPRSEFEATVQTMSRRCLSVSDSIETQHPPVAWDRPPAAPPSSPRPKIELET